MIESLLQKKFCFILTRERTDWAGGVCFDHAAEICDRLLQEPSFPVQHVPDGGQETRQKRRNTAHKSTGGGQGFSRQTL